jgi:hypothetical protein
MDAKKKAFVKFMNEKPDYYHDYYKINKEHVDKKHYEYVKNNLANIRMAHKLWRDKNKDKNKKQPVGKLAAKRIRIAKSLEQMQKKADAFRASLNNIKENDLETEAV